MTLGRQAVVPALAIGAIALALLLVLADFSLAIAASAVPVVMLAVLIFLKLRSAGYAIPAAAAILVCLFGPPDVAPMLFRLNGPVWLASLMFAISTSATAAMSGNDVRAIVALGLSLAASWSVDPIGVFLVAAIIPIVVSFPELRKDQHKAVTLAILVLFIPIVITFTLSRIGAQFSPMALSLRELLTSFGLGDGSREIHRISPFALVAALAMAVPVFLSPLIQPKLRNASSVLAIMIGLAVVAAFAAAELMGSRRESYWLASAMLPVVVVVLVTLKPSPLRERFAVSASLLGLGASWTLWSL